MILLINEPVSKGILTYQDLIDTIENISGFFAQNSIHWGVLYSSLILVTMLWCTLLIIYRILTVTANVAAGMRSYHRVIEVMVESASLYSAVLIVLLVLEVRNDLAVSYLLAIAESMRVSHLFSVHSVFTTMISYYTPRESCLQCRLAVLQLGMLAPTIPGAGVPHLNLFVSGLRAQANKVRMGRVTMGLF